MQIELGHLPDKRLSPNERLHHMELYKVKKEVKEDVGWLVLEQGIPATPYKKAHITITWVAGDKRRRDIDNLLASMKAYIDGLVEVRLIEDDSVNHVSYTLRYERGDKNNTIIEVEEELRKSD